MVFGRIDQGAGLDHGGIASGPASGVGSVAGSVRGLQCVAKGVAGRGRDPQTATRLLAREVGRRAGESGTGNRLSQAERTELCWGNPQIFSQYRTDGAVENTGGAAGLHALYDSAGGLEGVALSLHGTKRYLRGQSDCQPAVWGNGRPDRDVCQHAGFT